MTEPEIFYNNTVQLLYHTCRLYVLQFSMRVMRLLWHGQLDGNNDEMGERWFEKVRIDGELCAVVLGSDAVRAAEAVLISMLAPSLPPPSPHGHPQQQPDIDSLSTAPDILFSMVSFAAAQLVMFKFGVLQTTGNILSGASDHLLERVIDRFKRAALAPDHAPAKYSQMISQLVKKWERRSTRGELRAGPGDQSEDDEDVTNGGPRSGIGPAVSAERFVPPEHHTGYNVDVGDVGVMPAPQANMGHPSAGQHPHHTPELPQHHSEMMNSSGMLGEAGLYPPYAADMMGSDFPLMNSDVFLDAGFWAGFMHDGSQDQQQHQM